MIHGGPGAAGEMAPVAQILAENWGVLEPWQTAMSLNGQVEELKSILEENCKKPITLVGYSWGAWLSLILAARYPAFVKKIILVSSGPFTAEYAAQIQNTRLSRLSAREQEEVKIAAFARRGELFSKADAFDPLPGSSSGMTVNGEIFKQVWPEAANLRKSGKLLTLAQQVKCPVVALHGDHDPHPAEGVQKPLSAVLNNFGFHLLAHCGHKPWQEKQARDNFFTILREELNRE
ncbi:MAG: alpha/beta hydrolase [bacterium]|nr:alpha/beta hydrolase [bacterium]MDD5354790.1 alpha/beta hydrolase [bacterium]MDD5756814.1 alpha/beta hydrolase [bacterium]